MNNLRHILFCLALVAGLVVITSCHDDIPLSSIDGQGEACVLRGIRARIDDGSTRAMPARLIDSIGKYYFDEKDEIIFTKIERTIRPITTFSYTDVNYTCKVSGSTATGQPIVSWSLNREDDIYWSDGLSHHTFIGYNLPHADTQTAKESGFDWNKKTIEGFDIYYGSLGNPTLIGSEEYIDYTVVPGADQSAPYSQEKLKKEDLLLSYTTEQQNGEDAMADIIFHHALASVRVVVTITGFSTEDDDSDAKTLVTDMVLHSQPTMYKWNQTSYNAEPLTQNDQEALDGFSWNGSETPSWDQKKEMKLWQPRQYHSSGVNRTFPFYGIVVPGSQNEVSMTFKVSYPNPLDPTQAARLEKKYTATLHFDDKQVEFRPGYCTNITVNLNHKNEKMTVGAEYMEWEYIDQPDEGTLRKNTTYLSYTDRSKITIVGDTKATVDDATWLYEGTSGSIYDIYGNDGTAEKPYRISTADQLLSFAYEVREGNGGNGRDFSHQFIKLDADITMQKDKDSKNLNWIGIGDMDHSFNGFFLGSGRYINLLRGEHFFYTVGENAVIDKLNFAKVVEVDGCGVVAHKNLGLICGCYIDGDVNETSDQSQYTGSIVGENDSFIIACAHVGKVIGKSSIIGGLVGFNNGTVMACYHCGEVKAADGVTAEVHATVGKRGNGDDGTNNSIMFSCYYNADSITHKPTLTPGKSGFPMSTAMMQSNAFVTETYSFLYDNTNQYCTQGENLRSIVLNILKKTADDTSTNEQLIAELLQNGATSDNVYELFKHHFSLNESIRIFTIWLDAIAAKGEETVSTNCHIFSKAQIEFLQQHYTATHQFYYTPATYPRVQ